MNSMKVTRRYVLTIRRAGKPVRRVVIPTLSDALEAAQTDAGWLRGSGSVLVSPILYVSQES